MTNKSIKLPNGYSWDSTSITHKQKLLSDILYPVVLYENTNGSNEDISLTDDVDNYSFIEIYYSSANKSYENSLKVRGDATAFSVILGEPWGTGIEVSSARYTVSGSILKLAIGRRVIIADGTVTNSNFVYIKKVIGYKN